MALKLVTPLQMTFQRDVEAAYIFDCANYTSSQVVDGGIVALIDEDAGTGLPSVGVAVVSTETAADGETEIVANGGIANCNTGNVGGTNARIVFNGTDRKDTADLKQLTILEGSGFVVETDQVVDGTYQVGDYLTCPTTGATRGKLALATSTQIGATAVYPVDQPVVAVVDAVVVNTSSCKLNIKWL